MEVKRGVLERDIGERGRGGGERRKHKNEACIARASIENKLGCEEIGKHRGG